MSFLHSKSIGKDQNNRTKKNISDLSSVHSNFQDATSIEPLKKKPKRFGEDFETGNFSDEYDNKSDDELSKYLEQRIDIESIDENPLKFWYDNRFTIPKLSRLARSIFSNPATTANVERQISASRMMISSRRTRLNPEQVNSALFLRSLKKKRALVIVFYFEIFLFISFFISKLYSCI